jgi:hypothetical protein
MTERPDQATNFTHQNVGARVSHNISSGLSAYGGYGYGAGRTFGGDRLPHHNIDAGLNFNRALSFTRRTVVSFSTGSAATRHNDRLRFHPTGAARLTHELGRTWSVWTAYGRRLQFHETWQEPGLANSYTFGIGGLVTRRLQVSAGARIAFGSVGDADNAPGFDYYNTTATLSYALARFASVSVSYSYYQHHFDDDVRLADGIPRSLDRNSVRVGVNLWAPLFERARRTNASR